MCVFMLMCVCVRKIQREKECVCVFVELSFAASLVVAAIENLLGGCVWEIYS